jgi:hypothetical protein
LSKLLPGESGEHVHRDVLELDVLARGYILD